jgi:hypothetical protein
MFDMERFNLTKLNDVKVKEEYQAKISNRFAALENADYYCYYCCCCYYYYYYISRAWENIRENMKFQPHGTSVIMS